MGATVLIHTGADAEEVAEEIRRLAPQLDPGDRLERLDGAVVTIDDLAEIYEARDFRPLWTGRAADRLERYVAAVDADGLNPLHYHAGALSSEAADDDDGPASRAERDVLRTDAFVRLARDLRRGRVDPRVLGEGARRSEAAPDPGEDEPDPDPLAPAALERLIDRGDVRDALDAQRPDHSIYRRMVEALENYRGLVAAGGWPTLPAGPLLARDTTSARVALLRERLAFEGYLEPGSAADPEVFDEELEEAVQRFQHTHGLNEDGLVGASVLRELNRPAEHRVEQLRANLERARWVLHDMADRYITVNIAGQRVYLIDGDEVDWETRAVVGDQYTRTPVFSAMMDHLVLNPTWTVPESINGEILESVMEDRAYLARQGFEVLDDAGRPVDLGGVDFAEYEGEDFPYTFRQGPGPTNSLGRVKFMFPNQFDVYLHDTPARQLFRREDRTFSHGCIRVEHPMELAAKLLPDWSDDDFDRALASGEIRTVELEEPLPVLVLYWTAAADLHGELHFYRDVYDRDSALLAALDRGPER